MRALKAQSSPPRILLGLLLLYFLLEYARPAPLQALRLQFLIVITLGLAWLVSSPRKLATPLIGIVAFVGWCMLGVLLASNNFAAYLMSRVMFGNLVIALGISWVLSVQRFFVLGIWSWVAVMTYVAVFAMVSGGIGPGGFIGDENDVALGLCTALPFTFFGIEGFRGWRRWAALGLFVTLLSGIVATLSRGGFVGLAALMVYSFIVSRHKLRNLGLVVLFGVGFLFLAPAKYLAEIGTISADDDTATHRFYMWTTAYRMWIDNPIMGVGAGNFPYRIGSYQPMEGDWPSHYFLRDFSGTASHSMYFELLAEHGLVGVGFVALVVVSHFRVIARARRLAAHLRRANRSAQDFAELYGPALAAGMVGFLAAGTFLSVTYYPYLWYFAGFGAAFAAVIDGRGDASGLSPARRLRTPRVLSADWVRT